MGSTHRLSGLGFTLIEILVVVALMGVVAFASVPFAEFSYVRDHEVLLETNLTSIRNAIKVWRRDCERYYRTQRPDSLGTDAYFYPPDIASLTKTGNYRIPETTLDFWHRPYLNVLPIDPFVGRTAWTQHYASGSASANYIDGIIAGTLGTGVFDVSPIASNVTDGAGNALRRGFDKAVDGTLYETW